MSRGPADAPLRPLDRTSLSPVDTGHHPLPSSSSPARTPVGRDRGFPDSPGQREAGRAEDAEPGAERGRLPVHEVLAREPGDFGSFTRARVKHRLPVVLSREAGRGLLANCRGLQGLAVRSPLEGPR
jgi:hypothetical protein